MEDKTKKDLVVVCDDYCCIERSNRDECYCEDKYEGCRNYENNKKSKIRYDKNG